MENIKKGDVIMLKSGGPCMTVATVISKDNNIVDKQRFEDRYEDLCLRFGESNAFYFAMWFTNTKLEEGYFPEETIGLCPSYNGDDR